MATLLQQVCLGGETFDLNSASPLLIAVTLCLCFGTLLFDLISKIASRKEKHCHFEVPITATSIYLLISALQRLITYRFIMKPDNLLYTLLLPNTLKCIVFQKNHQQSCYQ